MQKQLFWLGKALQGVGLVVILVGLVISIQLGLDEEGLASMAYEGWALLVGGGLFAVGWLLQRMG
ncbi:MAG: hypothetical protein WD226_11260 [Planctomycetota bacterium]